MVGLLQQFTVCKYSQTAWIHGKRICIYEKKYRIITLKIATFSPRQLQGRAFPGQLSLGADLKLYVGLTKSGSPTDLCGMGNLTRFDPLCSSWTIRVTKSDD